MENIALEAFRGLFIPYRLQMVLAGEEQTYFSAEADGEAEHTYLHETFHWWQTAMTGEPNESAFHLMNEVGAELMLQAWALQLLEIPPATTGLEGTIQCGFRYFDVENVCPHQIANACPGSFKPADGSPHPADLTDEDTLLGCPFEKLLAIKGVAVKSITLPER